MKLRNMSASIVNSLGQEMDFEAAMSIADPELCEEVHAMNLDTDQEYWDTYCKLHGEKYGEEFAPDCGAAW